MRVTTGLVGLLGLGLSVSVALAQGPGPVRGARLLPPQPLEAVQTPTVARGAAESLPGAPDSTPITRPGTSPAAMGKSASNPAWVNGTASGAGGVRTASGTTGSASQVRPLTPREDLSGSRGTDKTKIPLSKSSGASDNRNTATANTPFQGTSPNGQPVYAGPPAYRWYGWGSVTPGANPSAPGGHYPNASANWYAITGATPGAFPVPVMNPMRPAPGTEPPVYHTSQSTGRPVVTTQATYPPQSQPIGIAQPAQDPVALPPATIIPPEMPVSVAPTPDREAVKPITVPTIAVPPAPLAPTVPPTATEPRPVPLPAIPSGPVVTAPPATNLDPGFVPVPPVQPGATPSPLPVSVTDEQRWQPGNTRPATNEWSQGGTPSTIPLPVRPQSRAKEREPIARGQIDDAKPDPVASLIRQVCDGRSNSVDVRWTGTKKLTVSFECRTAAEAQRLAKDISGRAELIPYEIDFRVLVK